MYQFLSAPQKGSPQVLRTLAASHGATPPDHFSGVIFEMISTPPDHFSGVIFEMIRPLLIILVV